MKLLVKNGTLVTGEGQQRADLLIENERIARVAPHLEDSGAEILDAAGCLVFPGFIDAHTHLDMECAAGFTADDFVTGTRAALAGGTTTVVDFATQDKGQTLEQGLRAWEEKAQGKAMCDYGFHMAITDWTQDIPEQMADMCRRGPGLCGPSVHPAGAGGHPVRPPGGPGGLGGDLSPVPGPHR